MPEITTYSFSPTTSANLRHVEFGNDWPVVYILENGTEVYVGETLNASQRFKQHYENIHRRRLTSAHIISDAEYNKSATLDTESLLIQYLAADGKYRLQNGNAGLANHNYYDREKYRAKFEIIWEQLQALRIVSKSLPEIRNSEIFKYSPYKALTDEQFEVVRNIYLSLTEHVHGCHIVNGQPGTGKTIVATYLMKFLKEMSKTKDLKIGLVVPMTSLRATLQKVFKQVDGLSSSMVMGASDVIGKDYDVLIVDEAHRLRRRVNLANYRSFDTANKALGLGNNGTELDWIIRSSKSQVLFYDAKQTVRPGDIRPEQIEALGGRHYRLLSQLRVEGGEDYITFVDNLFTPGSEHVEITKNYDLRYFDNLSDMVAAIKEKEQGHGLSRLVAGYAWEWKSAKGSQDYDIELDGLKLKWNSTNIDWVNSPNAADEVGCIHTIQGYDLNYVGVIIGSELGYDPVNNRLTFDKKKYMDINGKRSVESDEELERYIINIYKTLLTRGIKGTYIHAVDKNLAKYISNQILL